MLTRSLYYELFIITLTSIRETNFGWCPSLKAGKVFENTAVGICQENIVKGKKIPHNIITFSNYPSPIKNNLNVVNINQFSLRWLTG